MKRTRRLGYDPRLLYERNRPELDEISKLAESFQEQGKVVPRPVDANVSNVSIFSKSYYQGRPLLVTDDGRQFYFTNNQF